MPVFPARIREGYFHGSHAPVGYKFAQGSNNLLVEPYTAGMVREVFRLFLAGESIRSISGHMPETYGNSRYDRGNNTADNLPTGLLFCGDCGARMYARKVSKDKKKYICHSVARTSAAMIKSDNCTNRLHPYTVQELDAIVIGEIRKLSLDRSYFDAMITEPHTDTPPETEALRERLKEIERQTGRLLNLYQAGIMELSEIQERITVLKEEKVRANIEETENSPSLPSDVA